MLFESIDPEELVEGSVIYSHKGLRKFVVTGFCTYGLDCSIRMIKYINVHDTDDRAAGTEWVLDESTIIKMFVRQE
jgi:hypothetical protein